MKSLVLCLIIAVTIPFGRAAVYARGEQLMVCHRTANRDAPENTLEAIREAKTLGCDVVEMDISRTLDGALVLLHDGPIDRVSTGSGEVEKMLSDEMALYDAGSWFNARFRGVRHARFLDALRLSKDLGLKIELDLKSRRITRQVYDMVKSEGMLERVSFGGHAEELSEIAPDLSPQRTGAWRPEMDSAQVSRLHEQGKFVVASFSYNDHELDFPLMQAAVAAGVDALSTDHPRLAADALGRSLESRALVLARKAQRGELAERVRAISQLSDLRDLPLTAILSNLIRSDAPEVSRAAAVALARRHDVSNLHALMAEVDARRAPAYSGANLAWLAGVTAVDDAAVHSWLLRGAAADEPAIAEASLRALALVPGEAPVDLLRRRLEDPNPLVRGAAALALARYDPHPVPALQAAASRLQKEIGECWTSYAKQEKAGDMSKGRTTFERPAASQPGAPAKIAEATRLYRGYQNVLHAFASLRTSEAKQWLEREAMRVAPDFSGIATYIAGFQLWDRADPSAVAPGFLRDGPWPRDRAEWTLLKHGSDSAPALRELLNAQDTDARIRAAQTLAWLGDSQSESALKKLVETDPERKQLYLWCLHKLAEVNGLRRGSAL